MLKTVFTLMRAAGSFLSDRRGVAATEAAFIAPIFIFGGLAMFDLGLAGTKRLELDQALRAGAQVSMVNITSEDDILAATLAALGETEQGAVLGDGICAPSSSCVAVNFACACSDGTANACTSLCSGTGEIPSAFLTIAASRRHDGLIFADMNLKTQITVQTR